MGGRDQKWPVELFRRKIFLLVWVLREKAYRIVTPEWLLKKKKSRREHYKQSKGFPLEYGRLNTWAFYSLQNPFQMSTEEFFKKGT